MTISGSNFKGILLSVSLSGSDSQRPGSFVVPSGYKVVVDNTCTGSATITHSSNNVKNSPVTFQYRLPSLSSSLDKSTKLVFKAMIVNAQEPESSGQCHILLPVEVAASTLIAANNGVNIAPVFAFVLSLFVLLF